MATPKIIADFESQLGAAISIGDTSFTLSSATDNDGTALPTGLYYFTSDNGTPKKEYLAGTLSGVSVTGVVSVSRQGVETSGAQKAHRVGSSVIITDFMTYKKYMDEIALVSSPDASITAKGVVEAATVAQVRAGTALGESGAVLVPTPDVMSEYPTVDEKDAMAGGGSIGAPSSSNKFATEALVGVLSFGDGSDGDVTISSATTLTRDMYYDNLVVTDTLNTGGFRIFVKGTISGAGTIKYPDANAGGIGGNSATAAGAGGAAYTSGFFLNRAGSDGGVGGTGTGASGSAGTATSSNTNMVLDTSGSQGGGGGPGDDGGASVSPGAAGSTGAVSFTTKYGQTLFQVVSFLDQNLDGTLAKYLPSAPGTGGGGGGSGSLSGSDGGSGGGGGASSGVVFIVAKTWAGTFTISAEGGNGGNGGDGDGTLGAVNAAGGGGGGGGGNGGVTVVLYLTKTWTGAYSLTGGTGGTGGLGHEVGANGNAGSVGVSYELKANSLL